MNIESAGHSAIRLKSEGEPATKAVQASLIARRLAPRRTVPINPPAYDPLANGAIERTVQEVNAELRKLKMQLEQRVKVMISSDAPVMDWALEHAAFLLTRMLVRADGKTAYERAKGKPWRQRLLPFGETCMYQIKAPGDTTRERVSDVSICISVMWCLVYGEMHS